MLRRKEFINICRDTRRQPILKPSVELCSLTGHSLDVLGETELSEERGGALKVIVVEGLPHAAILGMDALEGNSIINMYTNVLDWRHNDYKMKPFRSSHEIASLGSEPPIIKGALIESVVKEYEHIFSAKNEPIGCHPGTSMRILTSGGPIKQRAYRAPLAKRHLIEKEIQDMLEAGIIRPSSSPWASPCLLVPKKDGSIRFCVDYSKLNSITKKDSYPIPLIKDIFDQLQGATVFCTLDLRSGYWQIPVAEEDIEKTAFISHCGLFEFNRMPFGLTNAPSVFQRTMEKVLSGLIGVCCLIYIDDIVIFGKDEKEVAENTRKVFEKLDQSGFKLKPSKCAFGLEEIKLLGYIIDKNGVRADPDKVKAIAELGQPTEVPEVRSFLGMTGYYRPCMADYAHISEPLVALTRKHVQFTWGPTQRQAFNALKNLLTSKQVMAHPQLDKPYKLFTDACDYAIGAILCQDDEQGIERPVVYLSKQLSATQRRWATIEKEAYGVVYALRQLRPYLWGATFRVFTDHKPLTSLFTKEMTNTKIQRWQVLLAEYGAKVEYRKGKHNIRADMLSRIKKREEIATFDTADWVREEDEIDEDPGLSLPIIHDNLNLEEVGQEQQTIDEWTETNDPDSSYDVIKGVLYSSKKPHQFAAEYPRLVLPPSARKSVIMRAHTEVGHMGALKTLRKVQEAYVWSGMKPDIESELKKCATCIAHNRKQIHLPMGEMPIASAPAQIIGADLIGPFVRSPEGNAYVLTVIDHCTGWGEAYPIPRKTNEAVWSKFRKEYFPRHGYPEVLITDQGQEFNALEFRQYLAGVGVKHHRTTPYNPQSNGKSERYNKTFKEIVNKLTNNRRDEWEDQIGAALTAYNNATSTVTGHTPFFLMYGRQARAPLSKMLHPAEPLTGRLELLSDALKSARVLTEDSRKYNRERLAQKANSGQLSVGDSVVIKAQEPLTTTSRWDPHWVITQVRGKAINVRHQQTGATKWLNHNKVQLVDPDVNWDTINPRPQRQSNISTKLTGVRAQTAVPRAMEHTTQATKRKAEEPLTENHHQEQPKRFRRYLPRLAKRSASPTPAEQKKARIEAIASVVQIMRK